MRFATGKKQRIAAALAAALALALAGCAAKPVAVDPAPCLSVTFAGMSGRARPAGALTARASPPPAAKM